LRAGSRDRLRGRLHGYMSADDGRMKS